VLSVAAFASAAGMRIVDPLLVSCAERRNVGEADSVAEAFRISPNIKGCIANRP